MLVLLVLIPAVILHAQNSYTIKVDSVRSELQKEINENKSDTALALAYLSLAQLKERMNPDSAIQGYLQGAEWILSALGRTIAPSKEIARELKKFLADAYNNIGVLFVNQVKIPQALDYHYRSLKIREEINDKAGIAYSLNNIGTIHHYYLEDLSQALDNYLRAIKLYEEAGDKYGESVLLHNIAGIYKKQGDTARALDTYFISMRMHEELNDKQGISDALNNISVIYREKGDLKNAFEYGERSLKIREELGDRTGMAYTFFNLGEACLLKGGLLKAKHYGERSLELGKQLSNPDIVMKSANLLQKVFQKQQRWKEALQMNELYFRMRDSTGSTENRTVALRQQVKYEYEKRVVADSIKYLGAQHEKDLKIQQQKKIFRYLIAGFTVLVIFSLLALRLYNQKKKTIFSRKVLETEMKALRSQMNPHFTFNVLNSIQYYAGGNDMEAVQLYLHKFSILIRMILEQSRTSYISLEQEIVMLKLYMELEEMRFENKFAWSIDIDPSLHPSTIMIPGMLIQPLLENAIKHGIEHKKGSALINLAFSSNNSTLLCTITDNGIGRAAAEKLKKSSSNHFSAATKILNERIEALSALYNIRLSCITKDLFDKDGNSCGTSVSLEVPLNLSQT